MPSREPPAEALGADHARAGTSLGPAPTSLAEAEEQLAQAEALAEAARARAARLRHDEAAAEQSATSTRVRRLHRPSRRALTATGAVVLLCASLTVSGYVLRHHDDILQRRQRTVEFAAAARNAVVRMMTIDASKARDDLQRFIDDTTGNFKAEMLVSAQDFVKTVEQSKVSTKATVQAVAVQSQTKDSAVVLVVAKTDVIKPDQPEAKPRSWRVVVNLKTDGGQLKVSKVEFLQ